MDRSGLFFVALLTLLVGLVVSVLLIESEREVAPIDDGSLIPATPDVQTP